MKPFQPLYLLAALLIGHTAYAQITLSNFEITSNSIAFDISGTIPLDTNPHNLLNYLVLEEHPIWNPGTFFLFENANNTPAIEASFTGTKTLTQAYYYNNDIDFGFDQDLAPGEALNGRFSATFAQPIFNPAEARFLIATWGYGSTDTIGTFLTHVNFDNIAVPNELYFTYSFNTNSNGNLEFDYIVDAPPTGESYDLEVSTNLTQWSRINGYVADGIFGFQKIPVPKGSDHAFYRWIEAPE